MAVTMREQQELSRTAPAPALLHRPASKCAGAVSAVHDQALALPSAQSLLPPPSHSRPPQAPLLQNLIDLDRLKALLEAYASSAGLAATVADLDGTLLVTANWQSLCADFHSRHPEARVGCELSDYPLHDSQGNGSSARLYTCAHGLMHGMAPIVVDGSHVANAFVSQFLLESPDPDRFKEQARRFGFDERAYLAALATVPILSEQRVAQALKFLVALTELVGDMGLRALEQDRLEHAQAKARAALTASETRYRTLFEESPVAMWEEDHSAVKRFLQSLLDAGVPDLDAYLRENPPVYRKCLRLTRVLDVNQAAIAMFEAGSKQELLRRIDDLVLQSNIRRFWAAMMKGSRSATFEDVYITCTGKTITIRETCTVASGHEELADRVYLADVDISGIKRAAEEVRVAEERYRTLVESLQEVVVSLDPSGVVTYASPRIEEVLGYEPGAVVGRQAAEFLAPGEADRMASLHDRVTVAPLNAPMLRALAADGSVRHLRVFTSPVYRDGTLVSIAASMEDVTDLVKSEQRREQLERRRQDLTGELRSTVDAAVTALARTVELRDPYTAGHQERVAELAVAIARRLQVPQRRLLTLRVAAQIHDLGKISVPAEILSKPGRLSATEFAILEEHPDAAYEVLRGLKFPGPVARIIHEHHERLDGSGYPRGLSAAHISQGARILAVADVVEAMSAHRPYRPALGLEAALAEIQRGSGTLYDPVVVDACLAVFRSDGFTFVRTNA
jgi:PAS domain S-box-containing protein